MMTYFAVATHDLNRIKRNMATVADLEAQTRLDYVRGMWVESRFVSQRIVELLADARAVRERAYLKYPLSAPLLPYVIEGVVNALLRLSREWREGYPEYASTIPFDAWEAHARYHLGVSLYRLREYSAAEEELKRALTIRAGMPSVRNLERFTAKRDDDEQATDNVTNGKGSVQTLTQEDLIGQMSEVERGRALLRYCDILIVQNEMNSAMTEQVKGWSDFLRARMWNNEGIRLASMRRYQDALDRFQRAVVAAEDAARTPYPMDVLQLVSEGTRDLLALAEARRFGSEILERQMLSSRKASTASLNWLEIRLLYNVKQPVRETTEGKRHEWKTNQVLCRTTARIRHIAKALKTTHGWLEKGKSKTFHDIFDAVKEDAESCDEEPAATATNTESCDERKGTAHGVVTPHELHAVVESFAALAESMARRATQVHNLARETGLFNAEVLDDEAVTVLERGRSSFYRGLGTVRDLVRKGPRAGDEEKAKRACDALREACRDLTHFTATPRARRMASEALAMFGACAEDGAERVEIFEAALNEDIRGAEPIVQNKVASTINVKEMAKETSKGWIWEQTCATRLRRIHSNLYKNGLPEKPDGKELEDLRAAISEVTAQLDKMKESKNQQMTSRREQAFRELCESVGLGSWKNEQAK